MLKTLDRNNPKIKARLYTRGLTKQVLIEGVLYIIQRDNTFPVRPVRYISSRKGDVRDTTKYFLDLLIRPVLLQFIDRHRTLQTYYEIKSALLREFTAHVLANEYILEQDYRCYVEPEIDDFIVSALELTHTYAPEELERIREQIKLSKLQLEP